MKPGTKVKHYDCGAWRRGTFEGASCQEHFVLVMFDPPALLWPGGPAVSELVRLDEIEEDEGSKHGS